METMTNQILSGLSRSAFLFLITSGISLSYGMMGVLNLGHFAFFMVGAYVAWNFCKVFLQNPFGFWIATVLTCLTISAIAFLVERIWMRAFYRRDLVEVVIGAFMLLFIAEDVCKLIWGPGGRIIILPPLLDGSFSVFGHPYPKYAIFVIVLGVLAACGIWFMLYKTNFGVVIRAIKENPEMVAALGISIPKMYRVVFTLTGLLAAMASVAWDAMGTINLGMTSAPLFQTFCVLVIGGMGSFLGTAVGALVCGEIYSLGIAYFPRLALLLVAAVTGIILAFRPWGLFGVKGMIH